MERNPTRFMGRKKTSPNRWGHGVSDVGKEAAASHVSWASRARAKAGKRGSGSRGDGPRAEKQAAARGGGLRARDGPPGFTCRKPRRMKSLFSFSFSIISKHFQIILNPILNLNQTTLTKNSNATA
jgi:hypothetical protein